MKMKITFIGVSSCIPDVGSEVASLLIDGKILVDTGWCNISKGREYGFDPLALECILFTHFHQDHYMGLPQLLFYLGLRKQSGEYLPANPLCIVGPSRHLNTVVSKALEFIQICRFPQLSIDLNLVPLSPGESYQGALRIDTSPAKHVSDNDTPEQALVYKFTGASTEESFAFTGDTSFHPPIAEFVKNVPILIHDALHSSPRDAATIAKMAKARSLHLIHYPRESGEELLAQAKVIFPNSFLAIEGEEIEI